MEERELDKLLAAVDIVAEDLPDIRYFLAASLRKAVDFFKGRKDDEAKEIRDRLWRKSCDLLTQEQERLDLEAELRDLNLDPR